MIQVEKATYTVGRMCGLLEVSRSGYYKRRKSRDGGPTPARQRRAEVDAKVAEFHAACDGVCGAPRVLADLRADGERVSRKTVAASLRATALPGRRWSAWATWFSLGSLSEHRNGVVQRVTGIRWRSSTTACGCTFGFR